VLAPLPVLVQVPVLALVLVLEPVLAQLSVSSGQCPSRLREATTAPPTRLSFA
jgi:hypothetical protein